MDVKKNSFLGFLGPNGAGKSTTIKMLTNLTRADAGKAYLNGIDVVVDPKNALAEVGAVVETPEFYPYFTPAKSLEYIAKLRGMSNQDIEVRTKEVLDLVKMSEERDKKIGKFSKGMKQRVAIAQSLMFDPTLIILDEPTSGLDPRGMVEVRDILLDLKKEDLTIIMSSHLLNEVNGLCDTVAIMSNGKLVLNEPVEVLKQELGKKRIEVETICPFNEDILNSIIRVPGVIEIEQESDHKITIDFRGEPKLLNSLLRSIDPQMRVVSFHESGNPLESLYLGLIKESR